MPCVHHPGSYNRSFTTQVTFPACARGAIAQLGERLDRTQEVGGSSPPSSTRNPCSAVCVGRAAGPSSVLGPIFDPVATRTLDEARVVTRACTGANGRATRDPALRSNPPRRRGEGGFDGRS